MEVTPGDTKGSPRGSPGACYHQEILLVTVPVLLVFLSLHDVHGDTSCNDKKTRKTGVVTPGVNLFYKKIPLNLL